MPFFVLLLTPRVKKFELIHFQKAPEYITVQALLSQLQQLTQNVEFQEQVHVGFYCPKTQQQLVLGFSSSMGIEDNTTTTTTTSNADGGDKKKKEEEDPTSETNITDKNIDKENTENGASTITTTTTTTKKNDTSNNINDVKSQGQDKNQSTTLDDTCISEESTDPPLSDKIPTEISTTSSDSIAPEETLLGGSASTDAMDPVLDLESLGQVLVAIPKGFKMSQITKQANKILESPAFRLLTANSLDQTENSTVAQELEQLKRQSLTTNVAQFLNDQVSQNEQTTALYQQQQLDLEKRKVSPKATAPDAHGLSPLDAMRVAQNQQKAAARQQERLTLQQYQRQSDTLLVVDTTMTTTTGALSSPEMQGLETPATSNPSPGTEETTGTGTAPTEMFVSSAMLRRQSIEQQKQAELEAIRKQAIAQNTKNSPYFAASNTTPQDSLSNSRRSSYQEQTKAELESLSNVSAKSLSQSWRGSSHNADEAAPTTTSTTTTVPTNRSIKTTFITTTAPSLSSSSNHGSNAHNAELEELRKQGLTKMVSLQHVPQLVKRSSSMNSSAHELEELKTLGLTKSVKSQFVDTVKANEEQTLAYQAQLRDLQERKSKTKAFEASRNELSAADALHLKVAKQKREEELKKREAMGYYQNYKAGTEPTPTDGSGSDKDWKTTGKVLTTMGQDPSTANTKEWDAPASDPKSTAPQSQAPKKYMPSAGTTPSTDKVKQGCACIIL